MVVENAEVVRPRAAASAAGPRRPQLAAFLVRADRRTGRDPGGAPAPRRARDDERRVRDRREGPRGARTRRPARNAAVGPPVRCASPIPFATSVSSRRRGGSVLAHARGRQEDRERPVRVSVRRTRDTKRRRHEDSRHRRHGFRRHVRRQPAAARGARGRGPGARPEKTRNRYNRPGRDRGRRRPGAGLAGARLRGPRGRRSPRRHHPRERHRDASTACTARRSRTWSRPPRAAGVRRYLHMSAMGSAPDSPSEYGRTKAAGEAAVRASGLDWTIVRPSIIFGPGDGFVSLLAPIVRNNPGFIPVIGNGQTKFQPVSIHDVARVFADALEQARDGRPQLRGRRSRGLHAGRRLSRDRGRGRQARQAARALPALVRAAPGRGLRVARPARPLPRPAADARPAPQPVAATTPPTCRRPSRRSAATGDASGPGSGSTSRPGSTTRARASAGTSSSSAGRCCVYGSPPRPNLESKTNSGPRPSGSGSCRSSCGRRSSRRRR